MEVDLNSTTFSIQTLYRMYRDGDFYVDRRYQRKLVWTLNEKQLIDSILQNYPIPLILFVRKQRERISNDIIDDLQRFHAIFSFIEQSFATGDGRYFDVNAITRASQLAKKEKWDLVTEHEKLLSATECARFTEYVLPVTIIERTDTSSIVRIFERINSYGRRLSEQEQRQAGLNSQFSLLTRKLGCEIRGDVSEEHVPLAVMPEISAEGYKTAHGYGISAEKTFWSKEGILHFSSLRDSLDEQLIADILACILNEEPIQRSRIALDRIYDPNHREYKKFEELLARYGEDDLRRDFLAVFDRIQILCNKIKKGNLQALIAKGAHHNEISTIFAALFLAFY